MGFRPLRRQNGQIAIFLVLVFQILFIFFAMSINVGLVVYDKINLQNATDLAAYYGAQKQAEMLNQIGHINYQIRQAYKLLAFRLRVIGSVSIGIGPFGTLEKHPIFFPSDMGKESAQFHPRLGTNKFAPGVCIGSSLWYEYKQTEGANTVSLCQKLDGISAVPPTTGGPDLTGLVGSLNGFLNAVIGEISQKCKIVNVLNWQLTTAWLMQYILEANKRTEMIYDVANRMSAPGAEMVDFTGQSVYQGAFNTLKNNLTDPQRGTATMTLINSMSGDVSGGQCADPNFWLPKVEIYPAMSYVRMIWTGAPVFTCSQDIVSNRSAATLPPPGDIAMVGGGNTALFTQVWSSGSPVSMGVEKNPWCMPYMGVKASTSPRKVFSPFGGPVNLVAESYAKPFGGRIGPWYNTQWPSGSATSQGIGRTDPLLPARSIGGNRGPGDPADDLVNYSKYPGDPHGLNSKYALSVMHNFWNNQIIMGAPLTTLPPVFALAHYNHIGDPTAFESAPDSLVRPNGSPIDAEKIRNLEETAVAPDLFDLTYYSVEAQYSHNYFHPSNTNFTSPIGNFYLDIGSQGRNPYSVFNQVNKANVVFSGNSPFYMVDNPNQLLTGWTQNRAVDYTFPDQFGKCAQRRDSDIDVGPSPGGCPHGGRSGYSVKIVSRKYLKNINAPLGGPGNEGAIMNPPED